MSKPLLLIEFNEINFDFVKHYADSGRLPHFRAVIARHGVHETTSEARYEHLEPWIQWVTAHTGRPLAQHGVFRLGDITAHDIPQIWEQLEQAGLKVGAVSPMNARHRLRDPAFFLPDPWTATDITAPRALVRLHRAICQAVNDNAQKKVTVSSLWGLLCGLALYASPANYAAYLGLVASSRKRPWRRAMILDLLLTDVFLGEVRRTSPDFASLFLNAGAHIQHHYMFCSPAYLGTHRNPDWYIEAGDDPILEVLQLYDRVLGRVLRSCPDSRVMLATGLHQEPHTELTFYWRLRAHGAFLSRIGVPCVRVEPRMSRDFLVVCEDENQARVAASRLSSVRAEDGLAVFEVDNRGRDLFVMLTYPREIGKGFTIGVGAEKFANFESEVAFVAVKNGAHDGIGYFIDTGVPAGDGATRFPLTDLPNRIAAAMNVPVTAVRNVA